MFSASAFFYRNLNTNRPTKLNVPVRAIHHAPMRDVCIFNRVGNVIPVKLASMSPRADFIIEKEHEELDGDREVNHISDYVERYKLHLKTKQAESYLSDVSTLWDPLKHFPKSGRSPLELLPLSNDALDELGSLIKLMEKLRHQDKWSSIRQDSFHYGHNVFGALTMPIKLPGSTEILLPSNLLKSKAVREVVTNAAALVCANNSYYFKYYWMYCSIHITLKVEPGTAQRSEMIHVDGMMGANKNTGEVPLWPKQHVILSTSLPTAYYTSSWCPPLTPDSQPDYSQNWFYLMDHHCKFTIKEPPKFLKPNKMFALSPYLMHEARKNESDQPIERFFIRIGFGNTHYNGPNYTINPRLGFFRGLEERAIKNRPPIPTPTISI